MASSQVRSNKVFKGTNAERLALDTTKLEASDSFIESDTRSDYEWSGSSWTVKSSGGATHTADGFKPSQYDIDIIIVAGTTQYGVLATGVKLGAGRVKFVNRSATTHDARIAFGTSEANALANLTVAGGLATTGYYLPAIADGGAISSVVLGVPALATHYAILNATAAKTPTVAVTQGV